MQGVLVCRPQSRCRATLPPLRRHFVNQLSNKRRTAGALVYDGLNLRRVWHIVPLSNLRLTTRVEGSLDGDAFRQIPRLIHIAAAENGGVVGQQLQRHGRHDGLQEFGHGWYADDVIGNFNGL